MKQAHGLFGDIESIVHTADLSPAAKAKRECFILQNSFKEQQFSDLEDYIEASIMLQYNL